MSKSPGSTAQRPAIPLSSRASLSAAASRSGSPSAWPPSWSHFPSLRWSVRRVRLRSGLKIQAEPVRCPGAHERRRQSAWDSTNAIVSSTARASSRESAPARCARKSPRTAARCISSRFLLPDGVRLEPRRRLEKRPHVLDPPRHGEERLQAGRLEALPRHPLEEAQEVVVVAFLVEHDDRLADPVYVPERHDLRELLERMTRKSVV